MSGTTARLALPYPGPLDGPDGADVPYWNQALATALDGAAMYDQGVDASKPVSPVKGFLYWSTDTLILNLSLGSGSWVAVNQLVDGATTTAKLANGSVTTVKIADANVTTAKIAANAVTSGLLANGAVTATQIDNSLKPSAGAAGATEALRALGTAAGTASAGNDARLSDTRTPTDGTVTTAKIVDGNVTAAKLASTTGTGAVVLASSPTFAGGSGSVIQVGTTGGGVATPTPALISMDSTYGNTTAGRNFKFILFNDGTAADRNGFGFAASGIEYVTTADHLFYANAATPTELMRIKSGGDVTMAVSGASFVTNGGYIYFDSAKAGPYLHSDGHAVFTGGLIAAAIGYTGAATMGGLVTSTKSGTPADADFQAVYAGLICVDSSANKLWVRVGTTWRYVTLT